MSAFDTSAAIGAAFITGTAVAAKVVVAGVAATTSGPETDLFTSLGVFGAALAIAYYMLRRGDKREKELLDAQHSDDAKTAADQAALMERYVATLEALASSNARIAELERKLAAAKKDAP